MAFSDILLEASYNDQATAAELRALLRIAAIRFQAVEFEMSSTYLDLIAALRAAASDEPSDLDEILENGLRENSETKGCA